MNRPKTWKCDFKNCHEIARYYRDVKGTLVKVCLHHEVQMRKQRMGKPLDFSELSYEEISDLEEKDVEWSNFQCTKCEIKFVVSAKELSEDGKYLCPICHVVCSDIDKEENSANRGVD